MSALRLGWVERRLGDTLTLRVQGSHPEVDQQPSSSLQALKLQPRPRYLYPTQLLSVFYAMVGQGLSDYHQTGNRTPGPFASICALNDDTLLKTFYHCRLVLIDDDHILEERKWDFERWWCNLVQVCRKWRYLVLASAFRLRISLVCTYGTPIQDILAHLPPLPLIIDYGDGNREATAQDEERIRFALRRRGQVRRIRLQMPATSLRRLVVAIGGEFLMLEHLYIKPRPLTDDYNGLSLPKTFNAPNLRRFGLRSVTCSWRSLRTFIHILDDDSLLKLFHFCRPVMVEEDEANNNRILQGGEWDRERWWYKLAHVCRRWRCLILMSASHLGLSLFCTYGISVADMLAHSPPLPLVIDYIGEARDITAEEEEKIILALRQCDRVRRIRLLMPVPILQKLITAVDGEFPMLEYLYIAPPTKHDLGFILPKTFRAPHLRHLVLKNFAFPIRSSLLTAGVGLTTLSLMNIHPSAYTHPNELLRQLSLMPQLETLGIFFLSPVFSNREVSRQLWNAPIATQVTLPNLRWFGFQSVSAYLEAILPHMAMPLLEKLQIFFFHQLRFPVPRLLQFMGAAEHLRLGSARLLFTSDRLLVDVYPHQEARMYAFEMAISCNYQDWQVESAAQIFRTLKTVFSAVEHLTLEFPEYLIVWDRDDAGAGRIRWRQLLMSFGNVKTLRVLGDWSGQISQSLKVDRGESPTEPLPELNMLEYNAGIFAHIHFQTFIDARENAGGRPVTLERIGNNLPRLMKLPRRIPRTLGRAARGKA